MRVAPNAKRQRVLILALQLVRLVIVMLLINSCETNRGGAASTGLAAATVGAVTGEYGRLGGTGGRAGRHGGGGTTVALLLLLGHVAPGGRQLAHRLREVLLRPETRRS